MVLITNINESDAQLVLICVFSITKTSDIKE